MSFKDAAEYTIRIFNFNDTVDNMIAEWNDMALNEYKRTISLKPYAKEYIAKLKLCGVRLAVATSLPKALYEPALKNNGIYELFDVFCGADEVSRGKEFPDLFILASKRLGVPPDRCIVFEDLLSGVISAGKAGMKAFCLYDKHSEKHKDEILKIADGYLYDFKNAPLPKF